MAVMTSRSQKSQKQQDSSCTCPLGKDDCPFVAELIELRRQVSELSSLVRTDPLTGIANFRYFQQALERELERSQRSGQAISLVMLDIDFFKQVNDQWGHEVGNQALAHLARLLQKCVRRLDIPCRYGGEEFAVILPSTDLVASIQVAERIRRRVEKSSLDISGQSIRMTVSLGVATYTAERRISGEELVQEADQFLYQAKATGRNRVCHPEPRKVEIVSSEERKALADLFGSNARKKDKS